MLRLELINIIYSNAFGHKKTVCSDLSLHLSPGKMVMLAGRNGSGKSSLLRSIAGLQELATGKIWIDGKDIYNLDVSEIAAYVSIMFSTPPEMPDSTVLEVAMTSMQRYMDPLKLKFDKLENEIMEKLDDCGVAEFAGRKFISLSDGEKQKVMLARCLAQRSDVILLDEPLAFLDYPSRIEMLKLIQKLATENHKTIIFSSHDLDISLAYCDALLMLKENGEWKYYEDANEIKKIKPESLFLSN